MCVYVSVAFSWMGTPTTRHCNTLQRAATHCNTLQQCTFGKGAAERGASTFFGVAFFLTGTLTNRQLCLFPASQKCLCTPVRV